MTIVKGAGKIASTDQSPRMATSPPERAELVSATLGPPRLRTSFPVSSDTAPEDFDESAYLAAFPDVVRAIKAEEFPSALQHYEYTGRREGRLTDPRYEALISADTAGFPAAHVDAIYGCKDGQCLVLGWVNDDGQEPVGKLVLRNALGLRSSTTALYRYRRKDVTDYLGLPEGRNLGFWAIVTIERPETMRASAVVTLSVGAERKTFNCQFRAVDEECLRELALDCLAKTQTVGHALVETFRHLDAGLGQSLIALNLKVSRRMALGAQTVQIGVAPARLETSVIVCLFGRPELLPIQCALFSKCHGIESYEFIYVSNSPEMAELLIKDATIANRIYGMPITLILLPGNAGFGVANNVAAAAARSGRLLILNPDIFPMDPEWPSQHSRIVNDLPPEQVALFGAPLYYDDGSLMHGGMYFEVDIEFFFRDQQATRYEMLRVEHYGKGAPPHTNPFLVSRPVPAVSGAWMSVEREWFESLGGFSPEYIYGHYEDADLCLKSFSAGKPVWLHYLPFVHFEGKGSAFRPAFEGGRLVNRWHFTKIWGEIVKNCVHGPASQAFSTPTHR
jgi:GT2 family glycosyltransferase